MSRPTSWMRIKAIARRHRYVTMRSPHRLFDITLWPIVDVLLFGSLGVFVGKVGGGQTAFGYLLGGIVLWHVIYQSQISLSTGFLEETWTRNLLNLMVTPIREVEYIAGVALWGLVKLTLGAGLVAISALVMFSFSITDVGIGLIPIIVLLLAVGWIIGLFVVGLVLRYGTGAEALAWGIMFAVMPLSGVFYPVEALPVAFRPIALALPTTHAFAAMRHELDGGGVHWEELGIATIETVVIAGLAIWFATRMLILFRRRGYISRYS